MGVFPFEPLIVPVLFALPEGAGQLLVVPVRPISVTSLTVHKAMRTSDPARWLTVLLAQSTPYAEPTSRFHTLLPRPLSGNRLAIPVWTTVRLTTGTIGRRPIELEAPDRALDRMGDEIEDPRFRSQVMASVRRAMASDPFAQRIVGDDARLGALSEEPLTTDPAEGLPAVVALLPPHFTLGELQQAIAATLGLPPGAMESSSSFRRRLQEFVHRRVLREVQAPREASDAERIGRPPRHYVFDPMAWREWLQERGQRSPRGAGSFEPLRMSVARTARTLPDPGTPGWPMEDVSFSRERAVPHQVPDPQPDAGRLARLERMVERLAEELRRKAGTGE
jgi:hypothetical protein